MLAEPDRRTAIELALARGKDRYDKRESIRRRDMQREIECELHA